jgi:PAS domain S-box-containing protein
VASSPYIRNVTSLESAAASRSSAARLYGRAGGADKLNFLSMAETIGNMGHWHWHIAQDVATWSDQALTITGWDPGIAKPTFSWMLGIYHAEDRGRVAQLLHQAVLAAAPFEFDARVVRPGGEVRNVIVKGQSEIVDGKAVALFGVITDVTEAMATLSAIQDQHEMLDLAAELAQLGHWVWAADQAAFTFCSENLARIHGTTGAAFLARFTHPEQFASAMAPSYRERYRSIIGRALEARQPYAIEYRLVTPDGTQKEIHEIGHPLFDAGGALRRYIGTVQDITDAKRRENELRRAKTALEVQSEALRRSETKFRDIVQGSIQGILVLRDYKPVFANEAYARMLGLPGPDEVIALGDLRRMLIPQHTDFEAYWKAAFEGRLEGKTHRAGLRTIDGRVVWTDAIGRMIEWEGEPALQMTVIDVTERHLAEQELLNKTRELQELNLQKDKLFSIIAHDLKAPFNSVIGFSDLLVARAEHLSPDKVADYARLVRDAAISVHGLFDNLLAWAAFQIRDAAPRFAPVDLAASADHTIESLRTMAAEKGIEIENDIAASAPGVHVLADEEMLRIVLRNLISNGIKFSNEGGTVRLTAVAEPMVLISVRDDGVGMSAVDAANLFRLDRTISTVGTGGEKGTGLGLYLCHDIVARHGGRITVESAPGAGCAFHILWPRAYPQSDG